MTRQDIATAPSRLLDWAIDLVCREPSWNAEFWSGIASVGWGALALLQAFAYHRPNQHGMPIIAVVLGVAQITFLWDARMLVVREIVAALSVAFWSEMVAYFWQAWGASPTLWLLIGAIGREFVAWARLEIERQIQRETAQRRR